MKAALVGAAIVALSLLAGAVAYRYLWHERDKPGGFRDWVKNPDLKRAAAEMYWKRESIQVPEDISDNEIQRMVGRLFVWEDEDYNFHRLQLVGERSVPFLIQSLDDIEKATTWFNAVPLFPDRQTPFERICDLLEPFGPPETALQLSKYMKHEDEEIRQIAALALGNIGSAECIAPIQQALSSDDENVRYYACMGIGRGIESGRCDREFLNAIFPSLSELLNGNDFIGGTTPAQLLLAIDETRAIELLLNPMYFTHENDGVSAIIAALTAAGHKIPHRILLPFLDATRPLVGEYPHDYEYAEALISYALNPDTAAEQTFHAAMDSSSEMVRQGAAKGLAILAGVPDAHTAAFDALEERGFEGLSLPQKYYCAVIIYDGEVNNGGHAQYFVNSSGDNWKTASEGLKAIGAHARLRILEDATALFGAGGPSEDNDMRHRQLADFTQRQDDALSKLDDAYYAQEENITVLLSEYAVKHKEHFAGSN